MAKKIGRPKGSKKYAGERANLNVLLPVEFIDELDRIAAADRPRRSRAQLCTELLQMGLLFRQVHKIVGPLVDSAKPGASLVGSFFEVVEKELDFFAKYPDLAEEICGEKSSGKEQAGGGGGAGGESSGAGAVGTGQSGDVDQVRRVA